MLHLFIKDKGTCELPVVNDVDLEFKRIALSDTPLNRLLIEKIEQGKYYDPYYYIDRFGVKLDIDNMSSGCKAALCVANINDKVINLIECGINARDAIYQYCTSGYAITPDRHVDWSYDNLPIDVSVDGYHFTDPYLLHQYIDEERYFNTDMTQFGVERVVQ